jgi:hypothetical protein
MCECADTSIYVKGKNWVVTLSLLFSKVQIPFVDQEKYSVVNTN